MEFRAEARFMRVSPQKVRLVLDLIKGRRVEEAMNTLAFTKKGIAPEVHKILRSAVENANYLSQEKGLDVDMDTDSSGHRLPGKSCGPQLGQREHHRRNDAVHALHGHRSGKRHYALERRVQGERRQERQPDLERGQRKQCGCLP